MLIKASKVSSCNFNYCSSKEVEPVRLSFVNSSKNLYQDTKSEQFKVLGKRCQDFVDALDGNINSFINLEDAKYCCCTMYVVTRTRTFFIANSQSGVSTRNNGSRLTQVLNLMLFNYYYD